LFISNLDFLLVKIIFFLNKCYQGREVEWLFATAEGRRQLCVTANAQRLVVVHLGRDAAFSTLEAIQAVFRIRASGIRIRILLSSCKNSKKNLDSYYFVTLFDFLSLKNDVIVPSKSNKQKKLC
jgi:hypothetical protein